MGNFLLSIGAPLYTYLPAKALSFLFFGHLWTIGSYLLLTEYCSYQRFALVLYDISHHGVHQSPHPLWSLCPLCSFTIATNGRSHRMLYFSIQEREKCSKSTMSILSILSILSIACNAKVSEKVFFFNHLLFSWDAVSNDVGGMFNQGLLRKSVQKDYQEEIGTDDNVFNDGC